jgi:hypothetical protein
MGALQSLSITQPDSGAIIVVGSSEGLPACSSAVFVIRGPSDAVAVVGKEDSDGATSGKTLGRPSAAARAPHLLPAVATGRAGPPPQPGRRQRYETGTVHDHRTRPCSERVRLGLSWSSNELMIILITGRGEPAPP